MKRLIIIALALALASPALAENKLKLPFDPLNLNAGAATSGLTTSITKIFQDVASFISADNTDAIALATAIPSLQDGNGQQCWISMQSFAAVVKAHPIPLTLKVASDLEALRLAQIAANKMCANPACTVVFSDLVNTVEQVSPINIVVPSLTQLCSKVPQIALTAPITPPTVAEPAAPATTPAAK